LFFIFLYLRWRHIVKGNRRKRYIGFVLINESDEQIVKSEIRNEIQKRCLELFDKKPDNVRIDIIQFDGEKGIVRCGHTQKEDMIKLLNSIDSISNKKVKIKTVGTSGTIKKLIQKHM